jgi:hypothetical protein
MPDYQREWGLVMHHLMRTFQQLDCRSPSGSATTRMLSGITKASMAGMKSHKV